MIDLKQTHTYSKLEAHYRFKGQLYLVRVSADIACRGYLRGKGTTTSVWRVSDNPAENNENGVIRGVRGFQGPFSETALRSFLRKLEWGAE